MDPNSLTHYGVKGMKWGVRRTPAQLGHRPTGRKKNGAAATIGRAGNAAAKKVAGVKKARRDKIVAKAMASDASVKDLRKALPHMTDAEIQKKMDRNALEKKLIDSNADHSNKVSELTKTAQAVKRGSDLGDTEGVKRAKTMFVEEALMPMANAAGSAAGQYVLNKTADAAISLAAGKLGVSESAARSIAEQFKSSMAEDFAGVAARERSRFVEKNSLGDEWISAKEKRKAVDAAYERAAKAQEEKADREAYNQITKTWQDKQARSANAKKQALNDWVASQQPKPANTPTSTTKSASERKATVERVKQTQQQAAAAAAANRHSENKAKAQQMQSERFNKPRQERSDAAEQQRHEENKAKARALQEERLYRIRQKR